MKNELKDRLVEEGIHTLYQEFGPMKTIKFFQMVGVSRGDTLKEIEEITKKFSKKQALDLVKKKARKT